MADLFANNYSTQLAVGCTAGDTSLTLSGTVPTALQAGGQWRAMFSNGEIVIVPGGQAGPTVTGVTRGAETSLAAPAATVHQQGEWLTHTFTAGAIGAFTATPGTVVPDPTGVSATDVANAQAAINAAANDVLYWPAGNYAFDGNTLTLPAGYHHWVGAGFNQTKLGWATDRGSLGSIYAIDTSGATGLNLTDIGFAGPAPIATFGTVATNLACFKTKVSGIYTRCLFVNFYVGTSIASNHEVFVACLWSNNFINRRYLPSAQGDGTRGNQQYFGCQDLSAGFACVSVAAANDMDGGGEWGCYHGHAPYYIYGEPARGNGAFLLGYHAEKGICEQIGNAYVYDSDASGSIVSTTFDNFDCGALSATYNVASEPNDYTVKTAVITGLHISNSQSTFANPAKGAGTLSPYAPTGGFMFAGVSLENLYWEDAHLAIDSTSLDAPIGLTAAAVAGGGTFAGGVTFFYRITATNSAGETIGSVEKSAAPVASGSVNLAWTATTMIDGRAATGYKIYRATASNGQTGASSLLTTIGSGATVAFTDTGAATVTGAIPMVNTTTTVCVVQTAAGGSIRRSGGTYRNQPIRWAKRNGSPQVGRFDALVTWDIQVDLGPANTTGKLVYQKLTGFPILGIALHGDLNASGNIVPVAVRGARVPCVTRAADAAIGNVTYVKPDASNAGSCALATLGTDHPIMGVVTAASAGSLVEIDFALTT